MNLSHIWPVIKCMELDSVLVSAAIKAARASDVIRGKIGAILFTNSGYIVARASNVIYFGSAEKRSLHAEQFLLYKADRINAFNRYKHLNVLVVRWKKENNSLGNAKPCSMCSYLLGKYNVNVFYSNKKGIIVAYEY